jgi:hypothetical protein
MLDLSVLCMLVGSPGISFDISNFFDIYLFVRGSFTMFCIVFRVLNAIFISVSLKSFVACLVSFPLYVKVAHFVLGCCGSMFLILLCFCVVLCLGLCYICCCVVCFYGVFPLFLLPFYWLCM